MLTEDTSLLGPQLTAPQAGWASRLNHSASMPTGVMQKVPGGCCTCSGSTSRLGNPELREPWCFKMGSQRSSLLLVSEEHVICIILASRQTCFLRQRAISYLRCLSSVFHTCPRGGNSEWTLPVACKMCRNVRAPAESCLPAAGHRSVHGGLSKFLSAKSGVAEWGWHTAIIKCILRYLAGFFGCRICKDVWFSPSDHLSYNRGELNY